MKNKLEYYNAVKGLFSNILQDGSISAGVTFKENKEEKVLWLSVSGNSVVVDYYYPINALVPRRFVNDGNERLMPMDPTVFAKVIGRDIDAVINKTEVI